MKLKLNKLGRGRYGKVSGDIVVKVEKDVYTGKWDGSVSRYSFTGKCMATGKDVKCYDDIFNWSADTKTEVSKIIVEFILENL